VSAAGVIEGTILTPGGWIAGRLRHGDRVEAVEGRATDRPGPPYILPGFVDTHVHGGGGADMMDGAEAIRTAARLHARHGTTALCPTSVTAPVAETEAFLDALAEVMADPPGDAARGLGAHLEGPFLNPGKLGAQPPFAIQPDADLLRAWAARAPVRIVTFAPELEGMGALHDALAALGIRAQLGHSLCDYATARDALARGAGVTHLFNAMSGMSHRGNGLCGAAFAMRRERKSSPTSSMWRPAPSSPPAAPSRTSTASPTPRPVPECPTGHTGSAASQDIVKAGGAMRLPDGTLAGSALTMDQALRNLVAIGLPLDEAARRLSTLPADWLGLSDIGRIAQGGRADIVVADGGLRLVRVVIGGIGIEGLPQWG
jgi:N-acetylglucosamine-6-phosphate deacetylase